MGAGFVLAAWLGHMVVRAYSVLLVLLVHLLLAGDLAVRAVRGELEDGVAVGPVLGGVLGGGSALSVVGLDGLEAAAGCAGDGLGRLLAKGHGELLAVAADTADVVVGGHQNRLT